MNAKKVFRAIGKIFLAIFLLIVLFLLTTTIVYHIKLNKVEEQLKSDGYYAPYRSAFIRSIFIPAAAKTAGTLSLRLRAGATEK